MPCHSLTEPLVPFARTRTRPRTRWSGRKIRACLSIQGGLARAEGLLALTFEFRGRARYGSGYLTDEEHSPPWATLGALKRTLRVCLRACSKTNESKQTVFKLPFQKTAPQASGAATA
jgi:hypothetical protein